MIHHTLLRAHVLMFLILLGNICGQEWKFSRCSPDGVHCLNYGRCEKRTGPDGVKHEVCRCQRHFSGRDCSFPNTACAANSCKHGSFCSVFGCKCTNDSLYSGYDCSEVHCIENYCKNGGVCYNGTCICPSTTTGEQCELIVCGDLICDAGYCMVDECDCDGTCSLGCDMKTGQCKIEADSLVADDGLKVGVKVMIGVLCGITLLVVLPAIYAMHSMRVDNLNRNARLRSHMELQRMTQQAYMDKEENRKTAAETKAKVREERMLARQQRRKDSKFRKPDIPAIVLTDPVISQQNLPSPLAAYSTPAVDTNSKYSKSDFPEIALPDPVISQQNLPSPLAAYSRPAVDTESIAAHSKTAIDESPSSAATKLKDETSRKSNIKSSTDFIANMFSPQKEETGSVRQPYDAEEVDSIKSAEEEENRSESCLPKFDDTDTESSDEESSDEEEEEKASSTEQPPD